MRGISKEVTIGIMTLITILSLLLMPCATASSTSSITVVAKPSVVSDLPYKNHLMTWTNHCPLCDKNGTLIFNPKDVYEGELTCSFCDADYCGVTGKDKYKNGSRADLIPNNKNKINNKYLATIFLGKYNASESLTTSMLNSIFAQRLI